MHSIEPRLNGMELKFRALRILLTGVPYSPAANKLEFARSFLDLASRAVAACLLVHPDPHIGPPTPVEQRPRSLRRRQPLGHN